MPIPRLLHAIPITIQQLNRGASSYDPDVGEPIQTAARGTAVSVPGQVEWINLTSARIELGGSVPDADGYVLFRRDQLRDVGIAMINESDRFVQMGTGSNALLGDWYVTKVEPLGHWPDQGGATMLKCWFKDRSPAKARR